MPGYPLFSANAQAILDTVVDKLRYRRFEADPTFYRIFEQQSVFRFLDGVDLRADQLDAVYVEDSRLRRVPRKGLGLFARRRLRAVHRAVPCE